MSPFSAQSPTPLRPHLRSRGDGAFPLIWLLIALPLAGAAILLLGGRRTDTWGHWLGVLAVARRRSSSAVRALRRDARPRRRAAHVSVQHLFTWIAGRHASTSTSACGSTRCR